MKKTILAVLTLVIAVTAHALSSEEQIAERLKPVGETCMAGDPCASSSASGSIASDGPLDPETVYNTYCVACHASGVGNAPIVGDVAGWAPRIEKGIETLYESGVNGLGALMPAKGTCGSCSDEDIFATVDYMVEASQ